MYTDQFEEFRAQSKRGSVDSYFFESMAGQRLSKNIQDSDCPEVSASAPASRELTPVRLSAANRSAHSRSHSFKGKLKRAPQDLLVSEESLRPRTASMPNCSCPKSELLDVPGEEEEEEESVLPSTGGLYRVRSFKTSSKGITNRWEFYKSRSSNTVDSTPPSSVHSADNNNETAKFANVVSEASSESVSEKNPVVSSTSLPGPTTGRRSRSLYGPSRSKRGTLRPTSVRQLGHQQTTSAVFKVMLLGSVNVGKSALAKQFMTSEFLAGYARSISIDEDTQEKSVSVLLDGEESNMTFIDLASDEDYKTYEEPDAFVVIYSVDDRETFDHGVDLLYTIRKHQVREVALIFVGNKADLERTRVISPDEGKEHAISYGCKFMETSVALNHRVDDLLVGILSQVRLAPKREEIKRRKNKTRDAGYVNRATKGLLSKIFCRDQVSKSCENLLVV